MHETAEEEIVHPTVRGTENGDAVVDALLIQLRDDVLAHAAHEEREEFLRLREACGPHG